MRTQLHRALLPALGIIVASCASSGGGPSSSAATPTRRSDRNVLSADEVAASQETNLYDLVRDLRTEWLTARGAAASSPGGIAVSGRKSSAGAASPTTANVLQVYMNRQKVGTIDALKDISPVGIATLRYYAPTEAQAMFGTDNASGAIQIIPIAGGGKPN